MTDLDRTPLFERHVAAKARMVPFAGFEMPVQYSGVSDEHATVREAVGIFDVSHMGEIELRGPRALEVTNRIITNDLERIEDGRALYAVMCKPDGGILDDLVVYRFGTDRIFICCNASNRSKDFAWIEDQAKNECEVLDRSKDFAQLAVQGPKAEGTLKTMTSADLSAIPFYGFAEGEVAGIPTLISRTGYTGEDGFELYAPSDRGAELWDAVLEAGEPFGIKPIGLGARDSLRLEMKFTLYGNDIDESTNPLEAGLGWIVKLDKAEFVGKSALEKVKAQGLERKLIGFELRGPGIARPGYPVVADGEPIGKVTSGTKGPTVGKAVGMAYVPTDRAKRGSAFDVQIRARAVPAEVVKTPFYTRPK